ncbi:MAG: ATP-binding protein [Candidatus Omnitrophota bacterium]
MVNENPYQSMGMLPIDSDMFFGRQREMRRILDMLSGETPQCVSIIGERRIGKSSLANRVLHQLRNTPDTQAVYLDCDSLSETCQSKDHFFQCLNDAFGAQVYKEKDKKLFTDYPSFKVFISDAANKGIKTVIFLDEFEHLPYDEKKNKNSFADDHFFSNLRSMAYDPTNRLAFVTLSKTKLKELTHRSVQVSGFWNIFQEKPLGLLDTKSIKQLRTSGFKRTAMSLTGEKIEKIHYYAGDFPFFNQVACRFLWEAKINKDEPDWDELEVELFPFYQGLWHDRTREEQELLKHLKSKEDITLKEMKSRGVIIKEEESYLPFCGFFSLLIINKNLEIKKEKFFEKESVRNFNEVIDMAGKVKDLVKR